MSTPAKPGGGKYDDVLEAVWGATHGEAVLVIIHNGNRGSGFTFGSTNPEAELAIPQVLRKVADDIEAAHRARGGKGH